MPQPATRAHGASPGHPPLAEAGTMQAIVQDAYGSTDVLELRNIHKPEVTDDGVLVRVQAAGLHRGDWHIMTGLPYLIRIVVPSLGLRKSTVTLPYGALVGVLLYLDLRARKERLDLDTLNTDLQTSAA